MLYVYFTILITIHTTEWQATGTAFTTPPRFTSVPPCRNTIIKSTKNVTIYTYTLYVYIIQVPVPNVLHALMYIDCKAKTQYLLTCNEANTAF